MPSQTASLADRDIQSAKPKDSSYKLFDGGGLFMLINPAGGKAWRFKYRFGGKEKQLSFGVYPAVSLTDARSKRDEAKKLLAEGIDPSERRKDIKRGSQLTSEIQFMRDKITEIALLAARNKLSLEVSIGVRLTVGEDTSEVQSIGTFVFNCSGKE